MAHAGFVHLRTHSAYSLLEGAIKLDELVALCRKHDMPAVAVTDTGNLFGALEFALVAAKAGVQPIIGCQLGITVDAPAAPGGLQAPPDPLVLLVQSDPDWYVDIIAMIIIGREITVSALREWMATVGERANVQVSWAGKIKTTLQMFGIGFMVYENEFLGFDIYGIGFVLLIVAAGMTIWSMFVYLRAAWPFISLDSDT